MRLRAERPSRTGRARGHPVAAPPHSWAWRGRIDLRAGLLAARRDLVPRPSCSSPFTAPHGSVHGCRFRRTRAPARSAICWSVTASSPRASSSSCAPRSPGERSDLRPAVYHLQLGMSYGTCSTPDHAAKGREGYESDHHRGTDPAPDRHAAALAAFRGSYPPATRHSRLLDPHRYGAPAGTPSLEGFLFPSTYQLRDPISISALVADQLQTFSSSSRGSTSAMREAST